MFARKLIDAPDLTMTLDWFGMGKLEVTCWSTGQYGCASPQLKSFFIQTCSSLQERGVAMVPNSPIMANVFLFFARAILYPHDLEVRVVLAQTPRSLANTILSEHLVARDK